MDIFDLGVEKPVVDTPLTLAEWYATPWTREASRAAQRKREAYATFCEISHKVHYFNREWHWSGRFKTFVSEVSPLPKYLEAEAAFDAFRSKYPDYEMGLEKNDWRTQRYNLQADHYIAWVADDLHWLDWFAKNRSIHEAKNRSELGRRSRDEDNVIHWVPRTFEECAEVLTYFGYEVPEED
jgi:hypothetical protein